MYVPMYFDMFKQPPYTLAGFELSTQASQAGTGPLNRGPLPMVDVANLDFVLNTG
jgi:hypothetical protein